MEKGCRDDLATRHFGGVAETCGMQGGHPAGDTSSQLRRILLWLEATTTNNECNYPGFCLQQMSRRCKAMVARPLLLFGKVRGKQAVCRIPKANPSVARSPY
jgi:hypothetical protein